MILISFLQTFLAVIFLFSLLIFVANQLSILREPAAVRNRHLAGIAAAAFAAAAEVAAEVAAEAGRRTEPNRSSDSSRLIWRWDWS